METVCVFILLAWIIVCIPADSGKIGECPAGWTQVSRKCFKFVELEQSRYVAHKACSNDSSSLAKLSNDEENKAVQDLISGYGDAWIGSYYKTKHTDEPDYFNMPEIYRSMEGRCTIMLARTGRWQHLACYRQRPYVCGKQAPCEPGWAGDKCERRTHCHLGHFGNETTNMCPYGCEPGWIGNLCYKHHERPTVASFYCMKLREGYSMMVFLDWKGVSYSNVGAVNAEGAISSNCSKSRFARNEDGQMNLNVHIQNVSGVLEQDCPADTIADGILQWTFRFQMTKGMVSFEDEELQVQCDLSEADAAYNSEEVEIEKIRGRSLTVAAQTRVNIRTYIANPETLEPATNLSLGVPVILVATRPEVDNVVNPLFSPRNCQAASPDGKLFIPLQNSRGCPVNWRIRKTESDHGLLVSEMFRMFHLPGYTEVVFSCTFAPCFTVFQDCFKRCYEYYG
ncbi:uncharacterized protein [Haliotis cracherodii]|uniref:uncharacterized protein n=1 Tax=Haliotis cracherodii TaxID=6455 RepID=UPI0039EA5B01